MSDRLHEELALVRARLSVEGIRLTWTCTACPVQAEGYFPDGSWFYFRERHGGARVDVFTSAVGVGESDRPEPEWVHDGSDLVDVPSACAPLLVERIVRRAWDEWRISRGAARRT